VLSNDLNKNIFASWTKAVLLYCDGAFHQGNAKDPIKYKDTQLYFRGGVNTRAHFKFMDSKFPFSSAKRVVLTGSSAGGMATFIWADYVKTLLGK
jgi:O-palmitoleoyl-L-serine hydrolase